MTELKKRIIRQANEITNAIYKMTIDQKRIIGVALWKLSRGEVDPDGMVSMSVKDLVSIAGLTSNEASRMLKSGFKDIKKPTYDMPDRFTDGTLDGVWVQSRVTPKETGTRGLYRLRINTDIENLMKEIRDNDGKEFTVLLLEESVRLSNVHSARLYEMMKQYTNNRLGMGTLFINIESFVEQFKLPKSYERYNTLQQRVLDPALKEIKEKTGIRADLHPKKTGRKITHVDISVVVPGGYID